MLANIVYGALAFASLLFLGIAYRTWRGSNVILEKGVRTEGTVLDIVRGKSMNGRTTNAVAPIVQFKTQRGEVITYYSTTYTWPTPYEVGQTVPIWYLPDQPQQAALQGTDRYLLPLVFGIFGVVAMLFWLPADIKGIVKRVQG